MTTGSQCSTASATGATMGKVFLYAFDLIELDGDDLRREPLDVRKATLRSLLVKVAPGLDVLMPCLRNDWRPLAFRRLMPQALKDLTQAMASISG